jgi:transposase
MKEWFPDHDGIFMHDGAPCHTAKSLTNYLHSYNVEVLEWPGNSPDMNTVKNIWEEMEDSVSNTFSTTKQQFTERSLQAWQHDQIPIQLVQREIESMSRRIQALIKGKGEPTQY